MWGCTFFCSVLNLYTQNNHTPCVAILDRKCEMEKKNKYSIDETDVDTKVRLE